VDGIQMADGTVTIRLAEHHLSIDDEEFFTLRIKIHQALQGLRDGDNFTGLKRKSEEMDGDFDTINVWEMEYDCSFRDNSALPTYVEHLAGLGSITRTGVNNIGQ